MPRIHKAPVRYSTAKVLVAYLKGATIEFSFTKNADDTCDWGEVVPYEEPSDVHRLSNSEYSFRVKAKSEEVKPLKVGDVVIVTDTENNSFTLGQPVTCVSESCAAFEGLSSERNANILQILHPSEYCKC